MFTFLRLALLIIVSAVVLQAEAIWPHEHSDLRPDPRVTFGRLENGFRYMILPHANPAGRATLHLLVEAGSYYENEDERGLAHFVEHMVFNGTRDYPGDETVKTLQRLGVRFGPDVNAFTSMLETRYLFENIPTGDPATLPTGLRILRNFADGALFADQAVEKERKVICAEKRTHEGEMALLWKRELEFLPPYLDQPKFNEITSVFDKTRIEARLDPMGFDKTIANAKSRQLRAFYDLWYRPERMILAVVGDLDAATTEKQIAEAFASMRARSPEPKQVPIAKPAEFSNEVLHIFGNMKEDLPQLHITLATALAREAADTSVRRSAELARCIALRLIVQRLEKTLKIPGVVDKVTCHAIPGWELPMLRIATPAEFRQDACIALITEARRAQQYGFSSDEITEDVKAIQRSLADDERDAPNRTAAELASALVYAAARDVVFTDATVDRQTLEAALTKITPESCLEATQLLWPVSRTSLMFWGPIGNVVTKDLDALLNAWSAKLEPYEHHEVKPFPYTQFGVQGTVVSQRHDEALNCWFVQFTNGVRLNFKPTKFSVGQVKVDVRFGFGNIGLDRSGMGMAIGALIFGGLQELPFEDFGASIKKAGGHIEKYSFGWESDSFKINETLDDKNLPLGLQIITAYLTAPAFRESAEPMMRAMFEPQLAANEQTSSAAADAALRCALSGNHPGAKLPTVTESRVPTFAAFRDSIQPQLLNSPLEITLVGDLTLDSAITVVASTLGTLPKRPSGDALAARRNYTPRAWPRTETVHFKGNDSVGSVALAWTTPNEAGQRDDSAAAILSTIIEDRLRLTLRQEMGETYSPSVEVWSITYLLPSPLALRARIETNPKHVGRVAKAMYKVVDKLVRDGVTPDELERARQPLIKSVETNRANNEAWLNSLAEAQSKPQFVVGVAEYPTYCQTITREEINALARTLLVKERCFEIRAVPQ